MTARRPNRAPVTVDGASGKPDSAPRRRTPPIRLDSLPAIRAEAGRVYRECRAGRLPTSDLTRLIFALRTIADLHRLSDAETAGYLNWDGVGLANLLLPDEGRTTDSPTTEELHHDPRTRHI